MTRTVIIIVSLALLIGGLMTLRDQFDSMVIRAIIAACCGVGIAVAIILLRQRTP